MTQSGRLRRPFAGIAYWERPILMLVTERSPRLETIVAEAVAGGVDIVQWRDVHAGDEPLPSTLRQAAWPARLIANVPACVAARIGADGRHLPESATETAREARAAMHAGALIGRSAHGVEAARAAEREGADYVIAGTIFASRSHPDLEPAGLEFLGDVCRAVKVPVIAIGGVRPDYVSDCVRAGAAGVAVLSPIMHARDPRAAAAEYRAALDLAATINRRTMMTITVNGDERVCDEGATIGSFLDARGLAAKTVVVERNGEIVARDRYAGAALAEGDVLEIVQMMAGG